jgi:hypothetical protein
MNQANTGVEVSAQVQEVLEAVTLRRVELGSLGKWAQGGGG